MDLCMDAYWQYDCHKSENRRTKDGHPFHYPFFKTAPFEEVLSVKVNISNEIKLEDWGGIEIHIFSKDSKL